MLIEYYRLLCGKLRFLWLFYWYLLKIIICSEYQCRQFLKGYNFLPWFRRKRAVAEQEQYKLWRQARVKTNIHQLISRMSELEIVDSFNAIERHLLGEMQASSLKLARVIFIIKNINAIIHDNFGFGEMHVAWVRIFNIYSNSLNNISYFSICYSTQLYLMKIMHKKIVDQGVKFTMNCSLLLLVVLLNQLCLCGEDPVLWFDILSNIHSFMFT